MFSQMRKYTKIALLVFTIAIVLWDVFAFSFGKNATFSVIITDWSFYTPIMPLAWGVLIGHWFASPMGSKYEHVDKRPLDK